MSTLGEIEAAICEGITRFEQESMGRGPKDIRVHLIGDLLVVVSLHHEISTVTREEVLARAEEQSTGPAVPPGAGVTHGAGHEPGPAPLSRVRSPLHGSDQTPLHLASIREIGSNQCSGEKQSGPIPGIPEPRDERDRPNLVLLRAG